MLVTLAEEPEARAALDAAVLMWSRAQDAWDAATWAISHDPRLPESVPLTESGEARALTLQGAYSIQLPTLTLVYLIESPDRVIITEARFTNAKASQAGHA